MSRPSRNQDQLLIETAKRLLPETGISGMSLKRIADECQVNLGMFHYYFKTKSAFIRKVLESVNAEIEIEIDNQLKADSNPLEQLRSILVIVGLRILRDRKVLVSLIHDLMNRDRDVSEFIVAVHQKRMERLIPLIKRGQDEGYLEKIPVSQILAFVSTSVHFPTLISEVMERLPTSKLKFTKKVQSELLTEQAVIQRVDLALKAVSSKRVKTK